MSRIEPKQLSLLDKDERIIELEQDVRDFAFVNNEMLKLFGITIKDITEGKIEKKRVLKKIMSTASQAMIDEEGMEALFKHFIGEATRIGLKYYQLAERVSAEKEAAASA